MTSTEVVTLKDGRGLTSRDCSILNCLILLYGGRVLSSAEKDLKLEEER